MLDPPPPVDGPLALRFGWGLPDVFYLGPWHEVVFVVVFFYRFCCVLKNESVFSWEQKASDLQVGRCVTAETAEMNMLGAEACSTNARKPAYL